MRRVFLLIFISVFLILPPAAHPAETLDTFYTAKVKDISDRAYEPAVINLLTNAKESIVISMYILKPEEKNGPVTLLMNDLAEALARGVSVEIYLNTRFSSPGDLKILKRKQFKTLKEKGAGIFCYNQGRFIHDKEIIVDSRYVVEGSTNWSVSALKNNYETDVLIDSPELAKEKLERIKNIPLEGEQTQKPRNKYIPKKIGVLPADKSIEFKKTLLEDEGLFPVMVKKKANRVMDAYLLLLAEKERLNLSGGVPPDVKPFTVSLEDAAYTLKIPSSWADTAKRRQVIKVLRKLKNDYKLIDFEFKHGKDAEVIIKELPGGTFTVNGAFLNPDLLASKSASAEFVLLIKELLKSEGRDISSFTKKELTQRFHVKKWGLLSGLKETEKD